MSIFDNTSFTLKELCSLFFLDNKYNYYNNEQNMKINKYNELKDISNCYIKFTSNNNEYRKFLKIGLNKGLMYSFENNNINFIEILQVFDMNFNKLIIRIHVNSQDYNIRVTWDDIEKQIKGFNKIKFKEFYDDLIMF
jgi:viroplasmin and RNaseH domain-containing protein